ncbi:hypothetical protein [Pontibacillus litoralis]|uniref:Lipoprotein n=1 Tax=Pontibacillus litoralis JSM 072002 TaxID=1385512 RepID=A0A0A5G1F9_9BACI|nr:hypothetical protein [Pontibacillus litoralis]KGX85879.1 hypothetical protein N784_06535 [Pontibacillus litoralis JSM 072002]
MKKVFLLFVISIFSIVLVACSGEVENEANADKGNESGEKKQEEQPEEKSEQNGFNVDKAKEILEDHVLKENDEIKDLTISNGEIKAVIEIGDNDMINDKTLLAQVAYSSAGDEFLKHEGWEVLTIDFVGLAEVSMNRNEKETDDNDLDYFPMGKIIDQFE